MSCHVITLPICGLQHTHTIISREAFCLRWRLVWSYPLGRGSSAAVQPWHKRGTRRARVVGCRTHVAGCRAHGVGCRARGVTRACSWVPHACDGVPRAWGGVKRALREVPRAWGAARAIGCSTYVRWGAARVGWPEWGAVRVGCTRVGCTRVGCARVGWPRCRARGVEYVPRTWGRCRARRLECCACGMGCRARGVGCARVRYGTTPHAYVRKTCIIIIKYMLFIKEVATYLHPPHKTLADHHRLRLDDDVLVNGAFSLDN